MVESQNPRKDASEPHDYRKYIKQDWIRSQLQVYELLRRLRDDSYFRKIWVENELESRIKEDSQLDEAGLRDLLLAFLNEFEFKVCRNNQGRPVIRISPKTFRGQPYSLILGISSKNLSTCLNLVVESAIQDVIKGYGKGSVLAGIFGKAFEKLFNKYVVKRMQEEFGK